MEMTNQIFVLNEIWRVKRSVAQHKDFPVFNSAELVVGIAAPGCVQIIQEKKLML
jgi:hypothetical protein